MLPTILNTKCVVKKDYFKQTKVLRSGLPVEVTSLFCEPI